MIRHPRQVAILGFGLIGASIALALHNRHKKIQVTAFDREEVLRRAKRKFSWLHVARDVRSAVTDCKLIVLAAPLRANETNLKRIARTEVSTGSLILDVGSVKRNICQLANSLTFKNGAEFIGTHPMAGRELAGFAHADASLFSGKPWFIDSTNRLTPANRARLHWLLKKVGATPVEIAPVTHDMIQAELSHLPQLLSTLLGAQIPENILPLAGTGLGSMIRLAGSDYRVWRDILEGNKTHIVDSLKLYRDNLDTVIAMIESDESLGPLFRTAQRRYACLS